MLHTYSSILSDFYFQTEFISMLVIHRPFAGWAAFSSRLPLSLPLTLAGWTWINSVVKATSPLEILQCFQHVSPHELQQTREHKGLPTQKAMQAHSWWWTPQTQQPESQSKGCARILPSSGHTGNLMIAVQTSCPYRHTFLFYFILQKGWPRKEL